MTAAGLCQGSYLLIPCQANPGIMEITLQVPKRLDQCGPLSASRTTPLSAGPWSGATIQQGSVTTSYSPDQFKELYGYGDLQDSMQNRMYRARHLPAPGPLPATQLKLMTPPALCLFNSDVLPTLAASNTASTIIHYGSLSSDVAHFCNRDGSCYPYT